jgi:hypothetical protein
MPTFIVLRKVIVVQKAVVRADDEAAAVTKARENDIRDVIDSDFVRVYVEDTEEWEVIPQDD